MGNLCDLREFESTITVGDYCSVGDSLLVMSGGEHHPSRVSTWAFCEHMQTGEPGTSGTKGPVAIGNDVWIGSRVTVLSGVTIGNGAVIGAGSVVVRSIPDYAIAAGNPARVIRYRFDPDTIARLLAVAWWEWPEDKVRAFAPLIQSDDIQAFLHSAEYLCDSQR